MRNIKTPQSIVIILLTLTSFQCFSQTDFDIRRKKLNPTKIDTTTERIFIYEVPDAIIYFRQQDIKEYIEKINVAEIQNKPQYKVFQDTISSGNRVIKVRDIYYSYGEKERDSILRSEFFSESEKQLKDCFYFIGATLLLENKFMVVSKDTKQIEIKGLIVRRTKGLYGARGLAFLLPNKKVFYDVVTVL